MRFLLPVLLVLTLAAGVVYFDRQAGAANHRAERLGSRITALRHSLADATAELERAAAAAEAAGKKIHGLETDRTAARTADRAEFARRAAGFAAARQRIAYLERELAAEVAQRKSVDAVIEKTSKLMRVERARHNKEIWEAKRFMPEGVRQALITANDLLREDGQWGLRFLKAMKIEDKTLHGVQLLDRDPSSLAGTIYLADELTFDLDRVRGALTLCFRGGHSRGPYGREEFPMDGKRMVLREVDGRRWESRLPFLVEGHGDYPLEKKQHRLPRMESTRRAGWLRRVNALLERTGTTPKYRLETFRTIDKAKFTEALLLGYDDKKKLSMSAEADDLWIQTDTQADSVEIWVMGGTLRKPGGETPIPKSGYRIRLPGIRPAQALDAMLGMVKRK